jgi:Flp pilus assembly protein TadG
MRRPQRDDSGFAAMFTAAVTVSFIVLIGVVVDGGRYIRARSDVFGLAAAAARAGTQQIDEDAAFAGELRLNETNAVQAARDYLSDRGLDGDVHVDGLEVTVVARRTVGFQILPLDSTVQETATARATQERAP